MTEEEHVSRRGGFFELSGFIGEDFAGRAVFLGSLECMSILELCRMKRKGDHGLGRGWLAQEQAAERLLCVCPQKDLASPEEWRRRALRPPQPRRLEEAAADYWGG